jgi:hypothetical protein
MRAAMAQEVSLLKLSDSIEPLCPRDSRMMRYDSKGIELSAEGQSRATPYYRCGYQGCTVCYAPSEGYFTIIETPDVPQPVEEPGVNLLQCPRHGGWLYRGTAEKQEKRLVWRCGVKGCDYTRADFGPAWPSL